LAIASPQITFIIPLPMKRRKLLEAGTAIVGGTWLLNNFTAEVFSNQLDTMATHRRTVYRQQNRARMA
jgi:hypothetical protein